MCRYLLFAGDYYYPRGGWRDFIKSSDSKQDLIELAIKINENWWHILDSDIEEIIESGYK